MRFGNGLRFPVALLFKLSQAVIVEDGIQPGRKRRVILERAHFLKRLRENVLRIILRRRGVFRYGQTGTKHLIDTSTVKLLKIGAN